MSGSHSVPLRHLLAGLALATASSMVHAHGPEHGHGHGHSHDAAYHHKDMRPTASLSAEAAKEVTQDVVKITLAAELSGETQTSVANELTALLDAVMRQAKEQSTVKVSSGAFRVWPMNDRDGRITNWRGRGEIYLESSDFAAASDLASTLSDRMPIANLSFIVSPQARAKHEEALLQEAARAFQDRADALAQAFGYADYRIKEINLGGAGMRFESAPARMMGMAADQAKLTMEAGTEIISLSVNGTIFLVPKERE